MPRLLARIFTAAALAAALLVPALAQEEYSPDEAAELLPERVGDFRAQGLASRPPRGGAFESAAPESFETVSEARRLYTAQSGEVLNVTLVKTRSEGGAYSLLTFMPGDVRTACDAGAACVSAEGQLSFAKGTTYVVVSAVGKRDASSSAPVDFARALSATLDAGSGGLPPLALHLPEWERVQEQIDYAVSLPVLQTAAGQRPVLEAVSFEGGAEAATAVYGGARLVVVEFTTPQYAQDNDARITERIAQLRAEGRPVPAYRRVGNYSVFVFDAEGEAEAAQTLIEQVKYEKDVRWLGDNPHALERMQEQYQTTMGGVIVATLKATGLAILLCLGIGGLFGGAVFLRRRARSAASEAYSDAGGMLRLNIEDVNAPQGHARLVGDGEK